MGFSKSLGAAEFITFGLPRDLMQHMLWEVYHQIKNGRVPIDGMSWEGLLEDFNCISRKAVHATLHRDFTVSANWFWSEIGNTGHPEIFQLVWPSAQQGLYPWDSGCAQDVINAQPQLWVS